jgi:hypothetical protein
MRISNLNELYNYIKTKEQLTSDGSLMQLCACIDQFKNICSCKAKEKGQKLFDCNNKYVSTINNIDQQTIDLLFSVTDEKSIEFYDNSIHIKTISVSP